MSSGTSVSPVLTTWTVDSGHTHVEFAVRHLMISTTRGRFTDVRGTLTGVDGEPQTSVVDIVIGAASVDTRDAQRDAHLRSAEFLDVEQFPDIRFHSTGVEGSGESFKLLGDLTIRGVTGAVVLDVTAEGRGRDPWGGERLGFHASTSVKRSDFGLTWNIALEMGGVAVGDEVKISIDLEFVKTTA
jgi:polyisoprenoid-binding protein YceI